MIFCVYVILNDAYYHRFSSANAMTSTSRVGIQKNSYYRCQLARIGSDITSMCVKVITSVDPQLLLIPLL